MNCLRLYDGIWAVDMPLEVAEAIFDAVNTSSR
jgi:hypothetical protein